MEIKLGDRTYFLPDICTSSSRRKAALRKELQEHGAEAFLASRKLSPFARCVTEELVAAGAEVVDAGEEQTGNETQHPTDMDTPEPEAVEEV